MIKNPLQMIEYWPMPSGPRFKIYARAVRKNAPPRLVIRRALHNHIAHEINQFYMVERDHNCSLDQLFTQLVYVTDDRGLTIEFVPENSQHVHQIIQHAKNFGCIDASPPPPYLRAVVDGRQFLFAPVKTGIWL